MITKTPQSKIIELANSVNKRWLEKEIRKFPDLLSFIENYWNHNWGQPRIFLEMAWHAANSTNPICSQGNKKTWISWKDGMVNCGKQCFCAQEEKNNTMMQRYGVTHALQIRDFKEKAAKTLMDNHGTSQLYLANIDKKRQTNLERYGAFTPLESETIKDKTKQSLVKTHGVEYPFLSSTIQNDIQQQWVQKTGKKSFARDSDEISKQNSEQLKNKLGEKYEFVANQELFIKTLRTMSRIEMANFVGCSDSLIDKRIAEWDLTEFQDTPSHYETVISKFLNDIGIEYQENNRKIIPPKEIDWWIPSHKMGIEFCGLRWHGEAVGRGEKYHADKLQQMNEQGYSLITIFQDEWDKKSLIIKSIISNKLNIGSDTKIMARKTTIVILKNHEYSKFMNDNHIQGSSSGDKMRIGLVFENNLVAAMGLRVHKKYGWEVSRHANLINNVVVGGFGKMFSFFLKTFDPKQVLSYADLRYFTGESLKNNGFDLIGKTKPGYSYSKGVNRSHRLNHSKKSLVKKGHDPLKTESQIMKELGWDVIWDCGHAIWLWKKQ